MPLRAHQPLRLPSPNTPHLFLPQRSRGTNLPFSFFLCLLVLGWFSFYRFDVFDAYYICVLGCVSVWSGVLVVGFWWACRHWELRFSAVLGVGFLVGLWALAGGGWWLESSASPSFVGWWIGGGFVGWVVRDENRVRESVCWCVFLCVLSFVVQILSCGYGFQGFWVWLVELRGLPSCFVLSEGLGSFVDCVDEFGVVSFRCILWVLFWLAEVWLCMSISWLKLGWWMSWIWLSAWISRCLGSQM